MIQFQCDYAEGAHEKVLQKLVETNLEQTVGYGMDPYCEAARDRIREICRTPEADVHFLVGGTQTNTTVIAAALRPYEGVIAADSGHINVHETGAIEACGHKVLALPSEDGKITAEQVETYYKLHINDDSSEHMVKPGMVYISQPTELGTLYTKAELETLYTVCRKNELFLFVDGARLGYGLMAADCDMKLPELAANCDVFYIGGTKVGALFGEAVVINHPALKKDFRYMIKQKGGMLAKGRLLGIQFLTLLEDNLYFEISAHADRLAEKLREAIRAAGFPFLVESHTNQVFAILPDEALEKLGREYCFSYQQRMDDTHSAVRFCTSWATTEEQVARLCESIANLAS